MTNEQKANEIARDMLPYNNAEYHACYNSAIKAMEWKEEQHAKEKESFFKEYRKEILDACIYDFEQKKQQWIDKLEDWLANNICNAYNFRGDDISATFMNDCIKAMKGE